MDWGLTTALQNMYSGPNQQQQKQSEFAQVEQMSRFYEKEELEQEASAAKMQAYDAQVDSFADKLLASDRKRLYERSRVLKGSVREMIKANGGNMKEFFASGGHQIMADYKSSLVNSAESADYLENKQNMAFILKAMNEGKGHLISPKDKENFDRYMADGKGKISYGGVMNEIKMPDPSKFRGGVTMKADDILNENMMAVASNYAMYYKGTALDPANNNVAPTREELLSFTSMMYGSQIGSNYGIDIAKNQELRAQNSELRTQEAHPLEIQAKKVANSDAVTSADRNKIGLEGDLLKNEMTLLEMEAMQDKNAGLSQKLTSGQTLSKDEEDQLAKEKEALEPLYYSPIDDFALNAGDLQKYNPTPGNIFNATQRMIKDNVFFSKFLGPQYSPSVEQINYTGDNTLFDPGKSNGWTLTKFAPAAAYAIKDNFFNDGFKSEIAKKLTGSAANYDLKTNTIKDWKPSKGLSRVYHADGTNMEGPHGTMWDTSDYNDSYKGNYKILNVITAAVDDTADGRRQIIMSTEKNGKRSVSTETYDPKNKPKMSTFAVIKQDAKVGAPTFYVEIDPNNDGERTLLAASTKVTDARKNMDRAQARKNANDEIKTGVSQQLKKDLYSLRTNKSWQSAAHAAAGDGTYGDANLLNSYLAVVQSNYKTRTDPSTGQPYMMDQIATMTSNGVLSYLSPQVYQRIKNDKSYGIRGFFQDIVLKAKSPAEKQMIQQWRDNYFKLKNL
jgi:hypothetical protein